MLHRNWSNSTIISLFDNSKHQCAFYNENRYIMPSIMKIQHQKLEVISDLIQNKWKLHIVEGVWFDYKWKRNIVSSEGYTQKIISCGSHYILWLMLQNM